MSGAPYLACRCKVCVEGTLVCDLDRGCDCANFERTDANRCPVLEDGLVDIGAVHGWLLHIVDLHQGMSQIASISRNLFLFMQ